MRSDPKSSSLYIDIIVLITLVCLSLLVIFVRYDQTTPPFEDAAILMRYSLNLANGHGIVWNVGEKPVDGATDFLFMVAIAGLTRIGIELEAATKGLIIVSHVLLVALMYIGLRLILNGRLWLPALASAYLALGPAGVLASAYFGAPFFAFFVGLSWFIVIGSMQRVRSWHAPAFGISSVLMALSRPEGFLVGLSMVLVIAMYHREERMSFLRWYVGTNLVIGGSYLLWKHSYFGHVLPPPFYKKGEHIFLASLKESMRNVLKLLLPWLLAGAIAYLRSDEEAFFKNTLRLVPLTVFTVMWVLISPETNHFFRYQYAAMPLGLIAFSAMIHDYRKETVGVRSAFARATSLLIAFLLAVAPVWSLYVSSLTTYRDGRYDVAVKLRKFSEKGYSMAITEAGLLPLYSGWKAIDCWGLNDFSIARKGHVDLSTLEVAKPDIVMMCVTFDPLLKITLSEGAWGDMVRTMYTYSIENGYILAAAFGENPLTLHMYFVKSSNPDAKAIATEIASTKYYWYWSGALCNNYAAYLKLP